MMTPTTAIPVPSEPKPVPNRWVWVGDEVYRDGSPTRRAATESSLDPDPAGREYLLPGTALSAALAELERASRELEGGFLNGGSSDGYDASQITGAIDDWLEARRRVREIMPKGSNP